MKSKDPYLGQNMKFGQIPLIDSDPEEKVGYYILSYNRSNKKDVPLILGNDGGPGLASALFQFSGCGPFNVDTTTGDIFVSEFTSFTNYADYLTFEMPLGSGFSHTKNPVKSFSENNQDCLLYLQKLEKIDPNISKQRPIFISGASYAGSIFTHCAIFLKKNGYNIKGFINESPYTDPNLYLKYYVDGYYKQGTIWYWTYELLKKWGDLVRFGLNNDIYGFRAMSWFSETIPDIGITGLIHCVTDDRSGYIEEKCMEFWKYFYGFFGNGKVRKELKGGESGGLFSFDAHDALYLNMLDTMWKGDHALYDEFLNEGMKMIITVGEFDPYYGPKEQMIWVSMLDYAKKGLNDMPWKENRHGRFKKWGNLCVQVLSTGHMTQLTMPGVTYDLMSDLAFKDVVCGLD
jgi:hypothetical protein